MNALIKCLLALPAMNKIMLLNIAAPGAYLVERSFGIRDNIMRFNEAISAIVQNHPGRVELIDLNAATTANPGWLMEDDGHHIGPAAHRWIAQCLKLRLQDAK